MLTTAIVKIFTQQQSDMLKIYIPTKTSPTKRLSQILAVDKPAINQPSPEPFIQPSTSSISLLPTILNILFTSVLCQTMDTMGSTVWQLVCLLLGVVDYSIAPYSMVVLALPLILALAEAIVLSLLLLLLELPETLRHCWIRLNQKLHRQSPSTSYILLLPLELREPIWTMLLGDFNDVIVRKAAPILYTSYVERLRLYIGINTEYSNVWIAKRTTVRQLLPYIAFSQSCRHLHNEAGYFLYGNRIFTFIDAKALTSWIRNINPSHRRDVRNIEIIILKFSIPNDFFNQPYVTGSRFGAVQVHSAMQQLSGLRKLSIILWTKHWLHNPKYEAQDIYQLVRNVHVSETVIVQLEEGRDVMSKRAVSMEAGWPAHSQEDFAYAVWARILHPGSTLQQRVQVEPGSKAKYVLKIREDEE